MNAHTDTHDPIERLRRTVRRRDAAATRAVLSEHAEARAAVNEPLFSFDSPAIVSAAGSGNVELVRVLLEFGADPNRKSDWWAGGFHALYSANEAVADLLIANGAVADACAAAHLDRPALLEQLLDADPSRVHERGGDGQTPLHFARSRAVVDLLLDRGADPDARDVDHRATPAAWMLADKRDAGRYALAAYLVERGATADIFLAAALGRTDRLRELLRHDASLLELQTSHGDYGEKPPSSFHIYTWTIGPNLSPLQVAMQFQQDAAFRVMAQLATPRQRFLAACAAGRADDAREVLRSNPDVRATLQPDDARALPDAGWSGNAPAVALMLELGFDPSAPGQDGGTVLHCAAWQGSADSVRAVLRHDAGRALIETPDPTHGGTPLGWCCHGSENCGDPAADHAAVARMLLEAGADAAGQLDGAPDPIRPILEEWLDR